MPGNDTGKKKMRAERRWTNIFSSLWLTFICLYSLYLSSGVSLILSSHSVSRCPSVPSILSSTELLGCEMWKTAACMAIHYLVKLPRACPKPRADTERQKWEWERDIDRKRGSCNGPCSRLTGYQEDEEKDKFLSRVGQLLLAWVLMFTSSANTFYDLNLCFWILLFHIKASNMKD